MRFRARRTVALAASAVAIAGSAALAAPAGATTVTVTGDNEVPITLQPGTAVGLRTMNARVGVRVETAEAARYTARVLDPAGAQTDFLQNCRLTGSEFPQTPGYRGNGTYLIIVDYYAAAATPCANPPIGQAAYLYTVTAGVAIAPPGGQPVLTREPNGFSSIDYELGFTLNPGAFAYDVRYALGGVFSPTAGIEGGSETGFVNRSTGRVSARFNVPGSYTFTGRAQTNNYFTPWSAPVTVRAIAPFDFTGRVSFPDNRGPRYRLLATVREDSASGRVTVAAARRSRGRFRSYRTLGRPRIRSNGDISVSFRLRRGVYRLRFSYAGSSTVAQGRAYQQVRVGRRLVGSS